MKTAFNTIEEYLLNQPEEHRLNLELIRQTIKSTVPDATEVFSYQMPALKYHGMLCYYAVFKDHYSLFVNPEINAAFTKELSSYKTTKSAIHLPLHESIPVKLIEEIIRFAAISNLEKAQVKKKKK